MEDSIIFILMIKKLYLRKVKNITQGHTASKGSIGMQNRYLYIGFWEGLKGRSLPLVQGVDKLFPDKEGPSGGSDF